MNRPTRQLSVLRSLFRTLHPYLDDLQANFTQLSQTGFSKAVQQAHDDKRRNVDANDGAALNTPRVAGHHQKPSSEALRSVTDEHLVAELQNITSQQASAKLPRRNRKHYSRDTLLALLEEASVRIQVLETELEMARGDSEQIPLLTDEWEAPSQTNPQINSPPIAAPKAAPDSILKESV